MANGFHELVFNTQERLISTDLNRSTRFLRQDVAELLRVMFDAYSDDDVQAGAVLNEPNAVEAPLRAEIVGGFLVRPTNGSFGLTVDPGIMLAMAPDGANDESSYKYVRRESQFTGLSLSANASGSPRIDLVELQVGPATEVSDNRDVFNTSTGLFTATSLVKETRGTVVATVRTGTPGAGIPAFEAGKLPIAVVLVPDGATNNDACTFWDVRPLVSDREFGAVAHARSTVPEGPWVNATLLPQTDGVTQNAGFLSGRARAWINGRRIGGLLKRGSPGTDGAVVNLSEAGNQEPGITWTVAGSKWALYLMTPFGLPRWARYTDSSSGARVPRSPRGLLVISRTMPAADGRPLAGIVMPAAYGMGSVPQTEGVCIMSGYTDDPGSGYTTISTVSAGRRCFFGSYPGLSIAGASGGAAEYRFTITPGTTIPKNVKRLRLHGRYVFSLGAGLNNGGDIIIVIGLGVYPPVAGQPYQTIQRGTAQANPTGGAVSKQQDFDFEVDVPYGHDGSVPFTIAIQGPANYTSPPQLFITGYEFGP